MSTNTTGAPEFNWEARIASSMATVKRELLPTNLQLYALPHVVTEFIQKSANPNLDVAELAAIVEVDSGLTLELLKHVNSAIYALRHPVRSVQNAIVQIGINSARLHLLAVGMMAATRAQKSRLINHRNFWNESLQKGLFAREIARRLSLDPGLAFLGGLLQDYLLPSLTNTFDKEYLHFLNQESTCDVNLATWERKTFGFDHASAGSVFAAQWHLPDDLLCAVFSHHELDTILEGSDPELLALLPVAMASLLPDQLRQSHNGIQRLIAIAKHCKSIDLMNICQTVDADQMNMANGYEIPNHLSELLARANRMSGSF